jgi:hypothetical protein
MKWVKFVLILMVCGSKGPAVPYEENDAILEERYKKLGGSIEDKGHTHGIQIRRLCLSS